MQINNFINKYTIYLVSFFSLISFGISIFKTIYNPDPIHFSVMFSEANSLLNKELPYKEIFIIYGLITTIIHALSIFFLGKTILSISVITAFIYSCSFLIFFFILQNFKINKTFSVSILAIIFFIHPGILLPWSNYIAFFFLLLSIFFFSKNKNIHYFISGLFLGLSVLSRQTFFFSIFLFLVFTFAFENFKSQRKLIIVGFLTTLLPFFYFLFINNLFNFWIICSFKAHDLSQYSFVHGHLDSNILIIKPLLSKLIYSLFYFDLKWLFYLCILIFNLINLFNFFFFKKKNDLKQYKIVSISFLSVAFYSEAVHIPEIFRLSTGSIIGVIPPFFYFKSNFFFKNNFFLFYKKLFLLIISIVFIFIIFTQYSRINYNILKIINFNSPVYEPKISLLKHHRFSKDVSFFYEEFNKEILKMHSLYSVKYNYNFSNNALLPLISNTKSYQISYFHGFNGLYGRSLWEKAYSYRKDLDLNEKILRKDNDIVLFQIIEDKSDFFNFKFKIYKDNFFIFSELHYPFHNTNKILLILLPNNVNQLKY